MSESRNAVLKARFLHPGELSWYDVAERAARTWGSHGKHTGALYEMISRQRGVINTPAMANAGRVNQMGSACYVLPVNDSLTDGEASIMQTLMDAASVHKSGGGTGFSFGRIRGRGTPVSSTGRPAPGAVNVLKLYSQAISGVTQAGMRPGANMGILPVDHPDIEEFIKVKQVEGDIYNFNISVGMTDKFMKKVVAGTLDHHEAFIWESIVQGAWLNGEPGVFFIDTTNKAALHPERIEATNPCVTGDTMIATLDGPRSFQQLADDGRDVLVYAWHPDTKKPVVRMMRHPHKTRTNVPILEIEFDSGLKVRCTHDHHFFSFRGKKVKAKDLKVGKSVRAWSMSQHRDGHMRVHGWDTEANRAAHQWVHRMVYECFYGPVPDGMVVHHLDANPEHNHVSNLALMSEYDHQSHHYPDRVAGGFGIKKNQAAMETTNHKVVGIREAGYADVYNGCVDDAHSYIILDPEPVAGVMSGIVSANCGEVPLRPYEACVLGSINVAAYDWERDSEQARFCEDVAVMTEALDNVIERQTYPIPQIEVEQKRYRKIGVGLMGYADALVQHQMLYGSADAMWFADHIGKLYKDASYEASEKLSWSRGFYDGWEKGMPERRNLNCQVIAPTGTISRLAECSFGIEPHFDVDANGNYESFIVGGQFLDHNPHYNSPYFKPASQVTLDEHLDTQAAFQRHVDQAVSKTINCPYETTQREVEEAYIKAWQLGLKGTTILREGSRKDVVIGKVTEGDCVGGVCPV